MRSGSRLGVSAALALGLLACSRAPKVIARIDADATLLAAFDGRVYWLVGPELGWKDDAIDAPRTFAAETLGWASPGNFFVDATGVYFAHHNKYSHLEVPRGSHDEVQGEMRPAGEHPAGVARQGDCLYVLETDVECRGHGVLLGWPLVEGATCPQLDVPANGLQFRRSFAADAQRFYWADQGSCPARPSVRSKGIAAADRTTGAVVALAPDEHGGTSRHIAATAGVRQLVADARYLYWMTSAGDLVRASRPGAP